MKTQTTVPALTLKRRNKPDKEFLLFPLSETLYLLPKPAGSYVIDTVTGDSLLLGGLFYGLSKYLMKKDKEKLMDYMAAFREGNTDYFNIQKKAISIPFREIEKITISMKNPYSKELWYDSKLTIHSTSAKTYDFSVGSGEQLSEVESFFAIYLSEVPIEKK